MAHRSFAGLAALFLASWVPVLDDERLVGLVREHDVTGLPARTAEQRLSELAVNNVL